MTTELLVLLQLEGGDDIIVLEYDGSPVFAAEAEVRNLGY